MPPTDPNSFLQGRTRETTIFRDAQGCWFHDGQPLEHPNLCRAFDRWVDVADDGRYVLSNDINWAYITLEGAPLFVRSVRPSTDGLMLLLSDDTEEPLDPSTLRQGRDGVLYCDARGGRLTARFDPHAMMQLEDRIREDEHGVYLQVGDQVARPPIVDDPVKGADVTS